MIFSTPNVFFWISASNFIVSQVYFAHTYLFPFQLFRKKKKHFKKSAQKCENNTAKKSANKRGEENTDKKSAH